MTATQDLIAAALTASDDLDRICMLAQINPCTSSVDLREMCARAIVQPVSDVPEADFGNMPAGEVPIPEPAYLTAGFEGWRSPLRSAYSEDDMRTYGEQCRAAGYAAGVAASVAALVALKRQSGVNPNGTARRLPISRQEAVAALRGEVK